MKILVTGGSGFIGRNLVKILKERGDEVTTFDIRERNSNADHHIVADVRNIDAVKNVSKGMDYVFHLAAVTSPPEFEDPIGEGYSVNVLGTYNVLAASALNGVKRVVIASSSSVYGSAYSKMVENNIPETYSNLYPLTKRINEETARFFKNYGLETVYLRYFNTYGSGENSKGAYSSVIWKFIQSIRNGEEPVIYGDGKQRRDFIYVKDTARASIIAAEKGKPWDVYNVGTGISMDFNSIFEIVKEETGYKGNAKHITNPLKNYQNFTLADISKSKAQLGFSPEYDVKKGVKEILDSLLPNSRNNR